MNKRKAAEPPGKQKAKETEGGAASKKKAKGTEGVADPRASVGETAKKAKGTEGVADPKASVAERQKGVIEGALVDLPGEVGDFPSKAETREPHGTDAFGPLGGMQELAAGKG